MFTFLRYSIDSRKSKIHHRTSSGMGSVLLSEFSCSELTQAHAGAHNAYSCFWLTGTKPQRKSFSYKICPSWLSPTD